MLAKIFRLGIWLAVMIFLFVIITNLWVVQSTKAFIFDVSNIAYNDVALVLGTSKRTSDGSLNRFFQERMNTVAKLFQRNRVKHILVSGDNRSKYYNEPRDMLKALGDLHIPDSVVSLDYAGLRTLDSVVRCREVFGQNKVTIVTQEFHCYRSLFIAHYLGMEAIAVSADDGGPVGNMLALREVLARTYAVLDLYVFQKEPQYLGEKIQLPIKN